MALSVVRRGVTSLMQHAGYGPLTPVSINCPQVATIVSKAFREKDYKRPMPYPYKDSPYTLFNAFLDKTTHRFDENSKIIVVDGPIACGKTKFAKKVAEDLDMLYVPHVNMDMMLINDYGYDLRQLDPQLPENCRSFDENDFLKNPNHPNVACFQMFMFKLRLCQYIDALVHVLSTGQGVVMDRSVYSDFVFVDAMAKCGYLSKGVQRYYYESRKMVIPELMRPHLVIYLDTPVDVCLQRIKAPAITHQFLSQMEHVYKQQFLKEISTHAQILVCDWSEEGDAEVVVEDIEKVNFDFGVEDPKMSDWRIYTEWGWCEKRSFYANGKGKFMRWMVVPDFSPKELLMSAEEDKIFNQVMGNAPGMQYEVGYNQDYGDFPSLFRTKKGVSMSPRGDGF